MFLQVHVVCKAAAKLPKAARVIITSYHLCNTMKDVLEAKGFGVVIADECHNLKNGTAARTKAIQPLIKKAKRAILLSGTPALSRPIELYSQLHMLQPAVSVKR